MIIDATINWRLFLLWNAMDGVTDVSVLALHPFRILCFIGRED